MAAIPFLTRLETNLPILADGAMGTMIHASGVSFSRSFDALNLSHPGTIAQIHSAYIEAGAELILTNTFGANRYRLAKYGMQAQTAEINRAGVELARRAVLASFKNVWIAGDVGPLGVRLAPFGRVQLEEARAAFQEQIQSLVEAGVDLIFLETFSDLYEVREAIAAANEVTPGVPVAASLTYSRDDITLMGSTPEQAARELHAAGAALIGVNCSGGPAQVARLLGRMRTAVPEGRFLVKPNAGLPEQLEGRIMYPAGPGYFGEYARVFRAAGAALVGGCCGTTPAHIAEMRKALDTPVEDTPLRLGATLPDQESGVAEVYEPTQLSRKLAAGKFVFAVEMSPPRGINTQKIIAAAGMLKEAGADVIDVTDTPRARMRMSPWAVCNLIQSRLGIDTTLHFPTRGRNLLRVQGDLLAAHALNVRNIFVVMGDPTEIGDFPDAMDDYDLVPSGLIKLIKQGFNQGVDHAGTEIGQPTSFHVGCALSLTPANPESELKALQKKVKAGADFAITQPVFDVPAAVAFLEQLRAAYGPQIHIIAGILPLFNARNAAFLHNEVPGIIIPEAVMERMEKAGEKGPQEGLQIALEVVEQLHPYINGIYIMPPFSRFDLAAELIEQVSAAL